MVKVCEKCLENFKFTINSSDNVMKYNIYLYVLFPVDVLRFDNTYSIFQSKKVSFSVEVLLPSSDSQSQPETSRTPGRDVQKGQ